LPALVDRQFRARAPGRRASCAASARSSGHLVARAQSDLARISPRLGDGDRRFPQAVDVRLSRRPDEQAARRRIQRPHAHGDLAGRHHGCRGGRARADPFHQFRAGHGAGRRPLLQRARFWRLDGHRRRHNEDVVRMCRNRIRAPEQWWGDYLASLGAVRIAERELLA
jgi:hypothetical protein